VLQRHGQAARAGAAGYSPFTPTGSGRPGERRNYARAFNASNEDNTSPIRMLEAALGNFLQGLNDAMSAWLQSGQAGWTDNLEKSRDRALSIMKCARVSTLQWLKVGAMREVVAPASQTVVQWVADLRDRLEKAWHLCRFLHVWTPTSSPADPDDKRLLSEMQTCLPVLYDEIREAWIHVKHVQWARGAIAVSAMTSKSKTGPETERDEQASAGSGGNLIERLLAGPDDAELTARELAVLAAYLHNNRPHASWWQQQNQGMKVPELERYVSSKRFSTLIGTYILPQSGRHRSTLRKRMTRPERKRRTPKRSKPK